MVKPKFQGRVNHWVIACFGWTIAADKIERGHRFGEEAIELLQSGGVSKQEVLTLVDYVYGRPVGEFKQEVGGTMITLAALCEAHKVQMDTEGEKELERINTPEMREKIRAKRATKLAYSPLPSSES